MIRMTLWSYTTLTDAASMGAPLDANWTRRSSGWDLRPDNRHRGTEPRPLAAPEVRRTSNCRTERITVNEEGVEWPATQLFNSGEAHRDACLAVRNANGASKGRMRPWMNQ